MSLTLIIVEPATVEPGCETSKVLNQGTLIIGRQDPEYVISEGASAWLLPDETRRVSREHCRVFFKNDTYFIVDNESRNGTFLNGQRIAEKEPKKLHPGDRFKLCDHPPVYEIEASIQKSDESRIRRKAPWNKNNREGRNNNNSFNSEVPRKTSGTDKLRMDEAMQCFITGAGFKIDTIDDVSVDAFFSELGQAFREIVKGVLDLLEARDLEKQKLKIPRTTEIGGPRTNPFKAALHEDIGKQDKLNLVMDLLLFHRDQRHLRLHKALEAAFLDIKAHQWAMLKAINASLECLFERFDPKNLEQDVTIYPGLKKLRQANQKASQWDAYKQLYDEIVKDARSDFFRLFQGRFQEAYEVAVNKFKGDK